MGHKVSAPTGIPPTYVFDTLNAVEDDTQVEIAKVYIKTPGDTIRLTSFSSTAGANIYIDSNNIKTDASGEYYSLYYKAPAGATSDTVSFQLASNYGTVSSAAETLTLDPLPTIADTTTLSVDAGHSTVIAVISAAASETITLQLPDPGVSLSARQTDGTYDVIYSAPANASSGMVAVDYTVVDQNNAGFAYESDVMVDGGATLTQAPVAGNLERLMTAVIGNVKPGAATDALTLTAGSGFLGTVGLSAQLADGSYNVVYTAPAIAPNEVENVTYTVSDQNGGTVSGGESIQLDFGVTVTKAGVGSYTLAAGQSVVTDTVVAGLAGDVVTLTQTSAGHGTLSLVSTGQTASGQNTYDVVYTETGAFTTNVRDTAGFQLLDRAGGKMAGDSPYIRLDATGPKITAVTPTAVVHGQSVQIGTVSPAFSTDTETLTQTGGTSGTVTLVGTKVIYTAGATATATSSAGVTYTVTDETGLSNTASSSIKVLGAPAVTGNAAITATATGSFYDLTGTAAPAMTFATSATNSTVLLEGSSAPTITDKTYGLTVDVGSASLAAKVNLGADSSYKIDLLYGVGGYTTAAAAQAALTSDGHGGSLLALGSGSLDITNLAPASIAASHFKIG